MKELHRILHIDLQYQIIAVIRILLSLFRSITIVSNFNFWYFSNQKASWHYINKMPQRSAGNKPIKLKRGVDLGTSGHN